MAQFTDGHYAVTVHDEKQRRGPNWPYVPERRDSPAASTLVGASRAIRPGPPGRPRAEPRRPVRPVDVCRGVVPVSGAGTLASTLVGAIPGLSAGTAGAILGQNLDARVSTRSTYAGGVVAGVAAPVTVGTITDKTGYSLAASGLDAVPVEAGVNARQALSPILAASAGVVAGAGTGVVVIKGGNARSPGSRRRPTTPGTARR